MRFDVLPSSIPLVLTSILILCNLFTISLTDTIRIRRWDFRELRHIPKQLSDEQVKFLASDKFEDRGLFNSTLDSILVPRSPGTPGHQRVQNFITKMMKSLEWTVEEDSFTSNTPHGRREFTNIIATLNPSHCRRLILSCHYDSKLNRENTFVGAIDSGIPCALIIHMAQLLDKYLKQLSSNSDMTLQLVFFDGEEAFVQWSKEDSLYGSRHLANKWSRNSFPRTRDQIDMCKSYSMNRELDRIELMVLLDLIGSSNPKFYSYFPNTKPLFNKLIDIENKLNDFDLIKSTTGRKRTSYFNSRNTFGYVEDDHIPFLRRNVPILHIIPTPFPKVWHRESDNKENLNFPTIYNLMKIFRVFIAEYLHLDINVNDLQDKTKDKKFF